MLRGAPPVARAPAGTEGREIDMIRTSAAAAATSQRGSNKRCCLEATRQRRGTVSRRGGRTKTPAAQGARRSQAKAHKLVLPHLLPLVRFARALASRASGLAPAARRYRTHEAQDAAAA